MNTLAGLGMPDTSKTDEFSEKIQTAFDPPILVEVAAENENNNI